MMIKLFRKYLVGQLILTAIVLSLVMLYWKSFDSSPVRPKKSYVWSYSLTDYIVKGLTISRDEARKFSDHEYLMNHEGKCADPDILLLLLVKSAPEHFERRLAIRASWGNEEYIKRTMGATVKVLFVLGVHPKPLERTTSQQELMEEDKVYHDIIQQNFVDTFHNLTIKLLLQLGWMHDYCPHARFVMSADDDVFIHLPNLISYLQKVDQTKVKDFWIGKVLRVSPPIRDKKSKYYVSEEMYPWSMYPDYTGGAGYVMSRDVALSAHQASLTLNASLYIDDAFMGICANAMGISPQEHVFFSSEGKVPDHNCIFNQMMTSHGHVNDVLDLWKKATKPEVKQAYSGFWRSLYCTLVKVRHLCNTQGPPPYLCKAAFL